MIEVSDLQKKYGSFYAVKGVDFTVQKGEIVGLLGPNGAGKTTIMKILTGYHFPSGGKATIDDYEIASNPLEIKKMVGYLPENIPLYNELNVSEYLEFIADARQIFGEKRSERLDAVIKGCGLEPVMYKSIDKLSKGYKQRVGLAQAIFHDPAILILDEPTTGLDPNQIIEIRELIKNLGEEKTVILSTHYLQEVEAVCKRVLILNDGSIVAQGTPDEISRELKGEYLYTAVVQNKDKDTVESSLDSLQGMKKLVSIQPDSSGNTKFQVAMEHSQESGAELFKWAVNKNYTLLSMYREQVSLEDIFTKLTRDGGNANE